MAATNLTPQFTYRFFERFASEELQSIRAKLDCVLDDRSRQFGLFEPAREERGAAPSAPLAERSELGDALSPSQAKQFLDCSARWWFRYGLKLPDPKSSFLAVGAAVHKAVEANSRHKIETGLDLPAPEVVEVYADAWEVVCDETSFRTDESIDEIRATGARLIENYMGIAAPKIQPAAVETKVEGEIAGVRITGFIDLLDVEGRIIDVKTAARKPAGIQSDYAFQLATYRQLENRAKGSARLVTLVKTKKTQVIEHDYTITVEDQLATQTLYPRIQAAIRAGGPFLPNRGSNLCSRKTCNFWHACQSEYGGFVRGEESE